MNASLTTSHYSRMLKARIDACKGTRRSSCMGTAMYLTGEQARDEHLDVSPLSGNIFRLKDMLRLATPVEGCIVSWQTRPVSGHIHVEHMGVVVSLDPLMIADRLRYNGIFVPREPINRRSRFYSGNRLEVTFYLPAKLEKSLDSDLVEQLRS